MSDSVVVHGGVLADGTSICGGLVVDASSRGTTIPQLPVPISGSQFEAEDWSGEHADLEHEEGRRQSIYDPPVVDSERPIASSAQFERTRSDSLSAALLHIDPTGAPTIGFHKLGNQPFLEAEETECAGPPIQTTTNTAPAPSCPFQNTAQGSCPVSTTTHSGNSSSREAGALDAEPVLTQLLFTLRELKMSKPERHAEAVERLKDLEKELREAGAVCPPDPAVAEAVARALAAAAPGHDIQIRVNQSRHTTTTKTVYETETPGMVGLDADHIRNLQKQMLASLSSGATDSSAESGTTQKKESAEEGFTNDDGSVVVSKKMTRVVTTTRTTLPGEGDSAGSGE